MLDVKISNGTLIDGTGSPGSIGDIGIRGGRIVTIGKVEEDSHETIDASGKVVAPGFIDIHTHYDAQVFWDPYLTPSCLHGVTTILGGFCGFSIAPLTEESASYLLPMLARVEGMPVRTLQQGVPWDWTSFDSYLSRLEGRLGVNAGFFAGHSAIRRAVMGPRAVGEQATPDELEKMKVLLDKSLSEGAMGFSTTCSPSHNDADGNPVPSRHASREEMMELAAVCRGHEGTGLELLPDLKFDPETVDLLTDFSLAGQRPVNWNILLVQGTEPDQIERIENQLAATDYARAKGAEVVALTLPSTPTVQLNMYSGFVFDALPGWADLFRMPVAERIESLRDPAKRQALREGADTSPAYMKSVRDWPNMFLKVPFNASNDRYVDRKIGDIAAERGQDPFDVFLDLAIDGGLRTSFTPETGGEDRKTYELRGKLWLDDRTLIGASDAGAHTDMIDSFAFSTRLLENGVRVHAVITLEQAIQQITEIPARFMGLRERGVLREGWHADIVVFDPETVGCGKTYVRPDLPGDEGRLYADAIGIEHVLVNGEPIVRDGKHTGAMPGTVMRSGRDSYTVTRGGEHP